MVVSFIDGGNRSTQRKSPTCHNSLTNFYRIILYQVHLAMRGFELTMLVEIGIDCIGSCKSSYHDCPCYDLQASDTMVIVNSDRVL